MAKILAVANQKGGVGKTFLVFHLAHYLAEAGRRVLAVDLDPQGNLSLAFRLGGGAVEGCGVCGAFAAEGALSPVDLGGGLWLVSADLELARHGEGVRGVGAYFRLRRALEPLASGFDAVVLDCPPSLGLLSLSAFVCAGSVLVPLRPEVFSVSGLADLVGVVQEVRETVNPALSVAGLVLNAVQGRTRVARDTLSELRGAVEFPVLAVVPASVRAEEALRAGAPVWRLAPGSALARDLRAGLGAVVRALGL